jgi:hypothetical protein
MLAPFADTVSASGVVPFAGVTLSHDPPLVDTENESRAPLLLMDTLRDAGDPPLWNVNAMEPGIAVSEAVLVVAPTVNARVVV